ncbi:hyaluronidase-5-like [Colossoma macropomum]|uniref:hyaluronidase-5-like n=1 Tax=Colossoma macropomum TaxID=42526 RepID=UPI001864182C|nr:hyaluronidase-5-like [Colossoma macropomum]
MGKVVMQGQPGAATRLLYQIYILLQKKKRSGVMEIMQPAATARLHCIENHISTQGATVCHFSQQWGGSPICLSIFILFLNCYLSTASSLPFTAAPLFTDRPFAVIWNAPTHVCKNLNISLDLSVFQAVTTTTGEPDQFLFLFYTNKLGLYPYIDPTTKKEYNGGIPQKGNLTAHLERAWKDIIQYLPEFKPGLAVIDWESWRPLWARNWDSKDIYRKQSIQYAQEKDPSLSAANAVTVAKEEFEKAARSYMMKTMNLGIRQCPKYLWGYYLFPNCYNYKWDEPGYTGECPAVEIARNNELLWLWESSTAFFPSAYLPLSLKESHKGALFIRGVVKEAVRVSALPNLIYTSPIYVYLRPLFRDQNKEYLSEADLVRTIGESAALGASGAVLWGASADYNNKPLCQALAAYLPSTLNPYVVNVTAAAKLCSDTLCQSNGRCVRKNSNSDDYLHLHPDHFQIQAENGKRLAIGVPSLSDLKFFADKFTCQCYVGKDCSASLSISPPQTPVVIQV